MIYIHRICQSDQFNLDLITMVTSMSRRGFESRQMVATLLIRFRPSKIFETRSSKDKQKHRIKQSS